jgi:6-phosphofructokinase 1
MKILIAQGGGPTAVINQSLVGAVLEAKKQGFEIWGAKNGISGIVKEQFINLSEIDDAKLERVAKTPASALGSTRDKPDAAYCAKILEVFQKHDIHGFFYIGGNDSSETIRLVLEAAKEAKYEMKGFHIPKTVDNDLMENDHTPGFPSAARFVAKAVMGIERDNAALPGIHLCIIMGRHAGFLTAAGGYGGAHLTYIPEVPFDLDEFTADVQKTLDQHGRAVISISEGIQDKDGQPIISKFVTNKEVDAHGNVQLSSLPLGDVLSKYLKEKLKISRVRSDTFGYAQRSYPDPSPIDSMEARKVGETAVRQLKTNERTSGSITIKRTSDTPYSASFEVIDLEKVANKTRHMPQEFYNPTTKQITEAFKVYLEPLLGDIPRMETLF